MYRLLRVQCKVYMLYLYLYLTRSTRSHKEYTMHREEPTIYLYHTEATVHQYQYPPKHSPQPRVDVGHSYIYG